MTRSSRWEVGSEFHWTGLPAGPFSPWPQPASWHLLGRHSVLALLQFLGKTRVLWLPSYFCHDVAQSWAKVAKVQFYQDSPQLPHPVWQTLNPGNDDVVLAVNYFGAGDGACWRDWHGDHNCVLLEDHSHDSHSAWALTSSADYAFCSLRKLFPVPDGAILWSPVGRELPESPRVHCETGSSTKLAAMFLKAEYLAGRGRDDLKKRFRQLQLSGEALLENAPLSEASPFTREYLAAGAPRKWRKLRRDNFLHLLQGVAEWAIAKPLISRLARDSAPMGLVLVFGSPAARDQYREKLRLSGVFCPIHWSAPPDSDMATREFAARVFTIPCDQRYTRREMAKIVAILRGGEQVER